jgi:hypothetical protein
MSSFFLRRKECWVPTPQGLLVAAGLIAVIVFLLVRTVYPFLAINEPVETRLLVVEGWVPDYALEVAKGKFDEGKYEMIVTSGERLLMGSYLSEYKSFAELAAATLRSLGVSPEMVKAVPSSQVQRDRTFASAVALGQWLRSERPEVTALNVLTLGAHARRSRAIFQDVLGDSVRVGVIAVEDQGFDAERWWQTSRGVQVVLDETVGYLYWWFVGRPE